MKISDRGLALIKQAEGFVAVVYKDQAGLPTIGYGHLLTERDKRTKRFAGKSLTQEDATELLREDVAVAESAIAELVTATLSQNQFDALCDFVFNLGRGALAGSTLLKVLNRCDYAAVPKELGRWVKIRNPKTGELETYHGLVRRRQREVELWNNP